MSATYFNISRQRRELLLSPQKVNCSSCPFRDGRICRHPNNTYSWIRVKDKWIRSVHTLSNRYFPIPPAWCKRREEVSNERNT